MKKKKANILILFVLLAVSVPGLTQSASAQEATFSHPLPAEVKNGSKIIYHNGPVVHRTPDIYFIWYGCWFDDCGSAGDTATAIILADFMSYLGSTPYFQINSTYPDAGGQAPTGALFYGGAAADPGYSHGVELTVEDIQEIISDQIRGGALPLDTDGIYVVFASADVGSKATDFCVPSAPPHHGISTYLGTPFRYGFVGNPVRCPTVAASQFVVADGSQLPTPNGNLAADAMASALAHVLDAIVTNPKGSGWFDYDGLENADKCANTFGSTYETANGARANLKVGTRDFLIQQNWVNEGRGRCAMSLYP
jgi:hypothetical protein